MIGKVHIPLYLYSPESGEEDIMWSQPITWSVGYNDYDAITIVTLGELDLEKVYATGDITLTNVDLIPHSNPEYNIYDIFLQIDNTIDGSGEIVIEQGQKIVRLGDPEYYEYRVYPTWGSYTSAEVVLQFGALPPNVEYIYIKTYGNSYSGSARADDPLAGWPTKLTYIAQNEGTGIQHPSGNWPSTLKYYSMTNTHYLDAVMTGALPEGIEHFYLRRASLTWDYSGAMPSTLTFLQLGGSNLNNVNWTGLDIPGDSDMTTLNLFKFRTTKMSSADMITLLTNLENRTGGLPSTITINDYADYASPPQGVIDAVSSLKSAKNITTVNLGA